LCRPADDGEAKYDLAFKSKDNDGSQKKSGAEMADFYQDLCSKYPIISIEVGAARWEERRKKVWWVLPVWVGWWVLQVPHHLHRGGCCPLGGKGGKQEMGWRVLPGQFAG
jgi:hypothetical protein